MKPIAPKDALSFCLIVHSPFDLPSQVRHHSPSFATYLTPSALVVWIPLITQGASNPTPTSPEERQEVLLADPEIETVRKDRVFCRPCEKWIALKATNPYTLSSWYQHEENSTHLGVLRVRMQERRQMLLDDPHTTEVEARRVFCGPCGIWVNLRKYPRTQYSHDDWRRHKFTKGHMRELASYHHAKSDLSGSSGIKSNRSTSDNPIISRSTTPPFSQVSNNSGEFSPSHHAPSSIDIPPRHLLSPSCRNAGDNVAHPPDELISLDWLLSESDDEEHIRSTAPSPSVRQAPPLGSVISSKSRVDHGLTKIESAQAAVQESGGYKHPYSVHGELTNPT